MQAMYNYDDITRILHVRTCTGIYKARSAATYNALMLICYSPWTDK